MPAKPASAVTASNGRVPARIMAAEAAGISRSDARYILDVETGPDPWESAGWEAAWEQTDELEREQLLGLARRLADQRRRQQTEHIAELEELKRGLRERAAEVSRRELEVERRYRELEATRAKAGESRLPRPFRRTERLGPGRRSGIRGGDSRPARSGARGTLECCAIRASTT